jgi:RNA polymerase-associated protein CTR9
LVAEAEQRYRDLLVASPKMTECLLRLAGMRAARRNFEEATALAREALAVKEDDVDAMAFCGHLLMKQGKWAEAQAQFKKLRATPKTLSAQAAQLAAAAGKDPEAATHANDEYAMISIANAAYYQAVKARSSGNRNHAGGDEKSSKAAKEHLEYAAIMYTKALQKSETNVFAANGLGILLAERGKIEEAKATFQMVAEGLSGSKVGGAGDGRSDANAAAEDRASKFPDIWINQGHIQHAKQNYDAAARHYAQAQARFFHNLDHDVMLYQARNSYEKNALAESAATLRKALHVAPWNHRARFNLAYVIQEKATRSIKKTLDAGKKLAGGGVSEDGGTKAEQVRTAIDEFTLASTLFERLLEAATAAELGESDDGFDQAERKRRASARLGFDKKRVRIHVHYCQTTLKDAVSHLAKAEAEDAAFASKRESLMAERRAEMAKIAMQKAKVKADLELKRKAEEAAAAAARDKFKKANEEYMARTTSEREAEDHAEGARGRKKGVERLDNAREDDDDDDVLAPDAELGKLTTAEEKAALKATGLFSDSEEDEDEEEARDTDTEDAEDIAAEDEEGKADPEEASPEETEALDEDPKLSGGRRARQRPEGAVERDDKAKKAMDALAARASMKRRKKRGLESGEAEEPTEDEPEEAEPEETEEAPSRKRRKALVDDDDE